MRKGDHAFGTLLDTDGNGVSLEELEKGGVVLGANNQEFVLDAVQVALDEPTGTDLGTKIRGILEPVLSLNTSIGAAYLIEVLSNGLNTHGLADGLNDAVNAIAEALLSNARNEIQDASVSVTVREHSFEFTKPVTGNVIDPDGDLSTEPGKDSVVPGTIATQVQFGEGAPVSLTEGPASVDGAYGTLQINANGTYTYTPNAGALPGQADAFIYTISDGYTSQSASLNLEIEGNRLTEHIDEARIEYAYATSRANDDNPNALNYSWEPSLLGMPIRAEGSLTSEFFKIDVNTIRDVHLNIHLDAIPAPQPLPFT